MEPTSRRLRIGAQLYTSAVHWIKWWLLGGFAAALALTAVLVATGVGVGDGGVWIVAASIAQWFWGVSAAIWLYTLLPIHVAHGVTRREFTAAFAVFGVLTTATAAAFATTGFLAEHALLALIDQPLGPWSDAVGSGARYLLVTPLYFFGGSAISAVAIRVGSKRLLVPALLVVGGALYAAALAVEFYDVSAWNTGTAAWAGGALLLTGVLGGVCVAALRSVPIRPGQG